MTAHSQPAVSVQLYWSLPRPSRFTVELTHALEVSRALVVRLEVSYISGLRHTLREALSSACPEPERIEFVDLDEGSHLESEVGHHFDRPTLSALEFATWSSLPRTTVVLTPRTARARERCRAFLQEVTAEQALASHSTARLVVIWNANDDALVPHAPSAVSFDGLLTPDEMHAYVTLRMVGQRGPGSTSLARHLVTEFAGADPMLAEELMQLPHDDILQLPGSLSKLAPRESQPTSAKEPAAAMPVSPDIRRDWHASRAQGPHAAAAVGRLDSMYWRACVRSLLPWLEERRRPVIDLLRLDLEDYLYPTKGIWKKVNPWNQRDVRDVAIDDLEFNDIIAMANHPGDPFAPADSKMQRVVEGCRRAKRVRDALAHLRPPAISDIEEMVRVLDETLV